MAPAADNERNVARRRVPQQARSRDRVQRILDAAGELVVDHGVDALSTRSIAHRAELPVASLYQYFADKDEILLALVERDVEEMDAQVAEDLGALKTLTVAGLVATTMRAFVKVYHRRPAFVTIYLRGRTNAAIQQFCRDHNRRVAGELRDFARGAGLVGTDTLPLHAELAVEVGDRIFQIAFETEAYGDPRVVDEGISLVTSYLERFATPAGLTGVPA
ncbi:MAG: TetR/AcrR family transcriptional regulator [Nocardioidaceae bacterium]